MHDQSDSAAQVSTSLKERILNCRLLVLVEDSVVRMKCGIQEVKRWMALQPGPVDKRPSEEEMAGSARSTLQITKGTI